MKWTAAGKAGRHLAQGREDGIGLAESLVAIAITGTAAVTLVMALGTGSISVRQADELATARGLAVSQMERVKVLAYDTSGAYEKIPTPPDYAISLSADSAIFADSDIQQITVAVDHEGTRVLVLQGYRVNR